MNMFNREYSGQHNHVAVHCALLHLLGYTPSLLHRLCMGLHCIFGPWAAALAADLTT